MVALSLLPAAASVGMLLGENRILRMLLLQSKVAALLFELAGFL
jgi:hypothetical protein